MPEIVPMPTITALYAGLLGLLSIAIAVTAGRARGQTGITLGDGGNPEMIAAMRRHANFVEVVPLALILILLLELNAVSDNAIHGLGATLLVARAAHAFGFRSDGSMMPFRVAGAVGSTVLTIVASIWAITTY